MITKIKYEWNNYWGGGIQLLSSTDSTYCPDGELLFNDLSCGVSLTDRCVKFNDFF